MQGITLKEPDIRTCAELRSVLADPLCRCDGPVYEMYRGVSKSDDDRLWLESQKIRYDVTKIPGKVICGEWVKTKGHYHPLAPDGAPYPEIYEVIEGEALYLLQRQDLTDIVIVHAKKGDLILIPPGYGHITINPSKETLTMANLVSSAFSSDYLPFEHLRGAAYYLYADGSVQKNPKYLTVPPLRHIDGNSADLPAPFPDATLYSLIRDIDKLLFLNEPRRFEEAYSKLPLFR